MKHIVVGKAKKGEAVQRKRSAARSVTGEFLIGRVGGAVDFDKEPCVERGEVGDEAAERDLATKAEALDLFPPEPLPEAPLRVGRISPQAPRKRR